MAARRRPRAHYVWRGVLLGGVALCVTWGHALPPWRGGDRGASPADFPLLTPPTLARVHREEAARRGLDAAGAAGRTSGDVQSSINGLSTLPRPVDASAAAAALSGAPESEKPKAREGASRSVAEAESAFEHQLRRYADPATGRAVVQFGYDVFRAPEVGEPVDIAVGPDYVLGLGDHLVVSVWGNVVDHDFPVTVDREGQVRLPEVGLVALRGLSVQQAEEVLVAKFSQFYRNFEVRVRVGKVRDMYVHVIGRVERPGRVRVPSTATLLDALAAAGGVTKDGSLRRIRLRRPGAEDRTLDLYVYLLEGDLSVDVSLSSGDAVVVPPIGPRAAITGRVLRPAIYELEEEPSTLETLLAMAGGYGRLADAGEVEVESISGAGLSVRTVDLGETPLSRVAIRGGDVAIVREASPKVEQVVYLVGNVARPGRYAWREGMKVSDVLTGDALVSAGFWLDRMPPSGEVEKGKGAFAKASRPLVDPGREAWTGSAFVVTHGGTGGGASASARPDPVTAYPEPFLEYALIRRLDPVTKQEERRSFHLGKAILEGDPEEDLTLESQDTIVIFPRDAFQIDRTVFIAGAVHSPGEHVLYPGMRVHDLIRMAGGLLPEAYLGKAVLTRIHPQQDGAQAEHLEIDVEAVVRGDEGADLVLQPDDSLSVRVVPEYRRPYRVSIEGEVRQPGVYTVIPGERLSALIERAGGFTDHAYLPAAQFYRESVRLLQQERLDESLRRLEVETKIAAQQFTAEAAAMGADVHVVDEQARIDRLVQTIQSAPATGRMVLRLSHPAELRATEDDIELSNGDRIVVPRRPQEVHVVGAVFNQTALVYQEGRTAEEYLQACGGPTDSADMGLAYIIRSDGSADSAQFARKGYRWDSQRGRYSRGNLLGLELYPGDTLVVPYDVKPHLSTLGLTKSVTEILFQAAMATGVVVALL